MRRISIASIVEGDGEVKAVPVSCSSALHGREHDPALLSTAYRWNRGRCHFPIQYREDRDELERYVERGGKQRFERPGAVLDFDWMPMTICPCSAWRRNC